MMTSESMRLTVLVAYGTRPEAIKLAPVVQSLARCQRLRPVVVMSGQDRAMVDQVNELFAITPDADLGIPEPGQSPARITALALEGFSAFLAENQVDAVVVHGGSPTAFAASQAAFYAAVPVVRVEAGLRAGQRHGPIPEEIDHRLTTQRAALHLAPTERSRADLLDEGVAAEDIVVTGNTVIDALLHVVTLQQPTGDPVIDAACRSRRPIVVITTHLWESSDPGVASINQAVVGIARARPDALIVLPARHIPLVREQLLPRLERLDNVRVIEPLAYERFCYLLSRATLVLTDSDGIQQEAPSFGVPVLVTRDAAEWPEAVRVGAAKLVGTRLDVIEREVLDVLYEEPAYRQLASSGNPFGDGRAAVRTRAAIEALLGVGQRMPDFVPSQAGQRVSLVS